MKWRLAALTLIPGTLIFGAAPAQADEKSYLSYLESHGFKYQNSPGLTTPAGAVQFGGIICQNLRRGRPAKDRFGTKVADGVTKVMIDAAQKELCPDTLAPAATTTPAVPPPDGVEPAPPAPELAPLPDGAPPPFPPPNSRRRRYGRLRPSRPRPRMSRHPRRPRRSRGPQPSRSFRPMTATHCARLRCAGRR
ncbi:DUF732 domain-containing protein [Mycolicibacter hiberniae]|uniref:DUF732 domain-containing protein n=1 Tax=Mycolicibacter hiberniae TaxID=29314 RepID=UPI000A15D409|nr:DUF732 domain-containing protein [Mycolicibacter hiberniae]ORV72862.1 hypothetical protein AWC09_02910 [Mycolicibacter hiberniae]